MLLTRKAKAVTDVRSLARGQTEHCIRVLARIALQPKAPHAARVAAAQALLDRGWGKATQPLSGDPDGPALVVQIINYAPKKQTGD